MKRISLLLTTALILSACGGSGRQTSVATVPGQGIISITIVPNPIRATKVTGDQYDFPFEVILRETGGQPVEVQRVNAEVFFGGGLSLANETYDAARIRGLGFQTSIPANGELRYRFAPRRDVPDERLFSSVSAELKVDARDAGGTAVTASTRVTVTR